jgi:hypothetical protein
MKEVERVKEEQERIRLQIEAANRVVTVYKHPSLMQAILASNPSSSSSSSVSGIAGLWPQVVDARPAREDLDLLVRRGLEEKAKQGELSGLEKLLLHVVSDREETPSAPTGQGGSAEDERKKPSA